MAELRGAIERNELLLHYQPIINLKDASVCGVEALVRWKHPQHGMIPPEEFIGPTDLSRSRATISMVDDQPQRFE
jgi:sensor c-di-GMP phosphodiesterase-like protein